MPLRFQRHGVVDQCRPQGKPDAAQMAHKSIKSMIERENTRTLSVSSAFDASVGRLRKPRVHRSCAPRWVSTRTPFDCRLWLVKSCAAAAQTRSPAAPRRRPAPPARRHSSPIKAARAMADAAPTAEDMAAAAAALGAVSGGTKRPRSPLDEEEEEEDDESVEGPSLSELEAAADSAMHGAPRGTQPLGHRRASDLWCQHAGTRNRRKYVSP
jgi:hypothetical protein